MAAPNNNYAANFACNSYLVELNACSAVVLSLPHANFPPNVMFYCHPANGKCYLVSTECGPANLCPIAGIKIRSRPVRQLQAHGAREDEGSESQVEATSA